MKAQQNLPLVGHPEQRAQWHIEPSVATDHSLPLRHAMTEATISTGLGMAVLSGLIFLLGAAGDITLWSALLLLGLVAFLYILLRRYETHVGYVRSNRSPAAEPDLDADGKPDRVQGVWFGNGAPPAAAGSLDAVYRTRFAEFCAACRAGDTSVRYLRSSGFDDALQTLFRSWLMQYGAATWVSERGHNPGWELGEENALRKVLRCTGWQSE